MNILAFQCSNYFKNAAGMANSVDSKLMTSLVKMLLVNMSLKFQTLISQIGQYFLLKKCEKLLQCKSFSHFFQQKISVYLVIKL